MRLGRAAAGAALYACSTAALLLGHLGHGWGYGDLAIYREGGRAALDGAHLYALRFPGALAFTYPPASALLFTVLTVPSTAVLHLLATALSLIALPLMLWLALRLAPVRTWLAPARAVPVALLAAAAAVWLEPVWTTLRYGQIDVLIGVLVLYDLSRPDACRHKGAAIGLASALKLTPALFAVYLLLSRRSRAAALAAGVFCVSVAAGFAVLPGDSREYWGGAFAQSSRVGRVENTANQALRGALARVMHTTHVQGPWLLAAAAVALAGMALAVAAARRGDDAAGFCFCALTALLVSPVSWSHHWTIAVPALLLLAVGSWRRRSSAGLVAAGAIALLAVSHVIWWVPVDHPPHSELHLDALQLLFADAYVLVGLGALALGARALLARRAEPLALPARAG